LLALYKDYQVVVVYFAIGSSSYQIISGANMRNLNRIGVTDLPLIVALRHTGGMWG